MANCADAGDVVVVKRGEKFEVLADEFFVTTPAVADGEMYLRGRNTLYCIAEKK